MDDVIVKKEQDSREIINVIDEFDYSTQQESYNKRFIEWRRNKNNPYAYNLVLNKKESVYIEGQGFVSESAEKSERDTLGKILYVIGIAMLAAVAVENVFDKLIVQLLDVLGINIHVTFFNSTIYGGRVEVAVVLIAITLLKLLLPLNILHFNMKMKPRLAYPMSLNEPGELLATIAASLIVCVVSSIPAAYSEETKEIYAFFSTYSADVSEWGQPEFLVYTVFDVIIVSILFEMLFRGEMFHALRQFGDVYAVVITSVISGIVTQDFRIMIGTMMISAVSAVGALRSGTIFSAVAARITYKMYLMALSVIEMSSSENRFFTRNFFMLTVFVAGLLVFGVIFLSRKRREKKIFAEYNAHTPLKSRIVLPLRTLPLAAVVVACLLAAVIALVR